MTLATTQKLANPRDRHGLEPGSLADGRDDDIVDWDGPEDPSNPLNWPARKRFGHVVIVSLLSMMVNTAATIIAPGIKLTIIEFKVTNMTLATLSVSIYLLGFGLGPLTLSPLSERWGRLVVYHVCNIIFFVFVIGCAVSQNITQFIIFRVISGIVGSAPLAIGGGTIADCIPSEQRGVAGAIYGLGPIMGPVIGPIMGGFIAQGKGWRWTFWVLSIMSGVMSVVTFVFMRETHAQTLLERKAARLRRDTGNPHLQSKLKSPLRPSQLAVATLVRPIKMLIFSPVVLILSVYVAFVMGLLYLLFATFSGVFVGQYGFTMGTSGLAYLGLGIGEMLGVVVFGALGDKIVASRTAAENLGTARPEFRLVLMKWFAICIPVGLFIYGWTAYYKVHWFVPILGTALVGFGSLFVIVCVQIYLVEIFGTEAAASALATNILLRSVAGAFLPLAGVPMYEALNYGWGNTLLGMLALAFVPAPVMLYKYGEKLRQAFPIEL
ncbi:hypothetical protein V2A60_002589 [Cordyceps javanica]|uniref:MFS transporter n=1 Tax=Cordyceps javanica TaxID=43265 RepID=A0A545UY38_9HYPO|nr:MFS transporter [Cordyceps javanica]TQW06252.1 MFS transporter [Cordyceps javanica]